MVSSLKLLFLGLLLVPNFARADDEPSGGPAPPASNAVPPGKARAAGRHGGKAGKAGGKGIEKTSRLRGHCTLLESPMNPITGPCISVPLELKDSEGRSLGIARTSAQGDFEFLVDEPGPFHLAPSSSYYVLVTPARAVKKGEPVSLEIREKN